MTVKEIGSRCAHAHRLLPLVEVDKLSVQSLSGFVECVQKLRDNWPRHEHKELWFRGESYAHQEQGTFLHPVLYRPPKAKPLKPIDDLLIKEAELYDDFMRCAVQISDGRAEGEDWDWDAYFLMRHHSAPTRLLDWSDGALIALHFAVQRHEDDNQNDAVVYVLEPDLLKNNWRRCQPLQKIKLCGKSMWLITKPMTSTKTTTRNRICQPKIKRNASSYLYPFRQWS